MLIGFLTLMELYCTLWICSTRTDCEKYCYIDTLQWL